MTEAYSATVRELSISVPSGTTRLSGRGTEKIMLNSIISWSLNNRLLVLAGWVGAVRRGDLRAAVAADRRLSGHHAGAGAD